MKIIIPIILGAIVFLLVYKDLDFRQIFSLIQKEVHLSWILFSLLFGVLSNVIRAHRWQMMLHPIGENPRFSNTLYAVFSLYFMNALVPRLGEFYRCVVLQKYEKVPFAKALGTVVSERILDVISITIIFAIGILMQLDIYYTFFLEKLQISYLLDKIQGKWIIAFLLLLMLLIAVPFYLIKKKGLFQEWITTVFQNLKQGLQSVGKIDNKSLFITETFLIWICYFLQFYLCLFAFDFTSNLTWIDGVTLYIMGSLGVLIPVPQGIGTWHFMIIGTLALLGVAASQAAAFALLVHAVQTLLLLLLGFIAVVVLPLINKK